MIAASRQQFVLFMLWMQQPSDKRRTAKEDKVEDQEEEEAGFVVEDLPSPCGTSAVFFVQTVDATSVGEQKGGLRLRKRRNLVCG